MHDTVVNYICGMRTTLIWNWFWILMTYQGRHRLIRNGEDNFNPKWRSFSQPASIKSSKKQKKQNSTKQKKIRLIATTECIIKVGVHVGRWRYVETMPMRHCGVIFTLLQHRINVIMLIWMWIRHESVQVNRLIQDQIPIVSSSNVASTA